MHLVLPVVRGSSGRSQSMSMVAKALAVGVCVASAMVLIAGQVRQAAVILCGARVRRGL